MKISECMYDSIINTSYSYEATRQTRFERLLSIYNNEY